MGRQNVLKGDAHKIEAIEEWIRDIENNHDCRVRIVIQSGVLRRRVIVRVEACEYADGRLISVRVKRQCPHPNGAATDLCGTIFTELARLDSDLTVYANFVEGNGPLPDSPG